MSDPDTHKEIVLLGEKIKKLELEVARLIALLEEQSKKTTVKK